MTWTNTGTQPHSATSTVSETNPVTFDSGFSIPASRTASLSTQPGTYDYFCVSHPFMRGKVIVDPNAPAPAPGGIARERRSKRNSGVRGDPWVSYPDPDVIIRARRRPT